MDRTEAEEELSYEFLLSHHEEVNEYETAIYDAVEAIGSVGVRWMKTASGEELREKIELCDRAIEAFEAFRRFCYEDGRGGMIYFQDMWEHCFNSKNPDFSYIDSVIEIRERLIEYEK